MTIKTLFDPSKNIYRAIEKVITYNASQTERLATEIREYIATESIEDQFEDLLTKMQLAMEQGGENEVGVWVSGFYGSGKSSFTKYLGLALDDQVVVDGVRFLQHLQDRMNRPQTKALLNTVSARYPAAVVMLDLASEMVAGATMEDVSTVLYYKVLQWAGYSRSLKVALLERRLQKDGRYEEFQDYVRVNFDTEWEDIQNDTLVTDSIVPEIAHHFYPQLFKSPTAFSTDASDVVLFETDRVREMIDIVRKTSGKEYILFVIDEVGQYVGGRSNLILNLDGLAKNIKEIGDGKVWIVGTAQQTLTEDDPRAALNSPELFKLTARFPIQIDLESSDIKEICTKRLLGKSPEGEQKLGRLFDQHGQALRHNTRLQDARYYESDFNGQTFIDLYPFLPVHFDILLHLLGALAKSTGGIGLRSAIKVVQDVLIEGAGDQTPVADQPVGWLATTVTLYDALEKDIRRAYPSIHGAAAKAIQGFRDSPLHQEIAKTVAVLQILNNMPVTTQNVAALMHPTLDGAFRLSQVEAAVQDLMADPVVPFGEKDGNLTFFSEKLNEIDRKRAELLLRGIETRRIQNEALRNVFSPLPSTRLHNSLTVSAGLKSLAANALFNLAGEKETIQMLVEFVEPADYDAARARLVEESRQHTARHNIYLLGRSAPEIAARVAEIYRCLEIIRLHGNDADQEIKEYCAGQADQAARLEGDLQRLLKQSLSQGSLIFRGQTTAVESLSSDLLAACKEYVGQVAEQVFDRYGEAPVRAETALAEKFLRAGSLQAVTTAIDPLGLVIVSGGAPSIHTDHRALVSIKDYLQRNELVEGKRLTDYFTGAPFGWSQDTLRYLVAALLVAGEVRFKVGGREVTVNGQQALDALRTNNSFRNVGIAPRNDRPSSDSLARASGRLTDLVGDMVLPLEEDISKATARHVAQCQHRFGPLAEKLDSLDLPGVDTVRMLLQEMADILLTDASDAPQRLGGEESAFYDALKWAGAVDTALRNGLEETVRTLQQHCREIEALPDIGITGNLRRDLAEPIAHVQDRLAQTNFYRHATDFQSVLTQLQSGIRDAAEALADAQAAAIRNAQTELRQLPDWTDLSLEEQQNALESVEKLAGSAAQDLAGLRELLNREYVIHNRLSAMKHEIAELGRERRQQHALEANGAGVRMTKEGKAQKTMTLPVTITSLSRLDAIIQELQLLRSDFAHYGEIQIVLEQTDNSTGLRVHTAAPSRNQTAAYF